VYHAFVRRRIRNVFTGELSRGHYPVVVSRTSPGVVHSFPGEGALGGTRHSRDALRYWFERLFRLFPVLRFEVDDISVAGWPWRTIVTVRWRDWGSAADGQPYANAGCEVFEIRWGRATKIDQYLDTKAIHDSLTRMAAAGIEEAAAAPILDAPERSPKAPASTAVASGAMPG
jgi:ketosteroid isomerase-like protein